MLLALISHFIPIKTILRVDFFGWLFILQLHSIFQLIDWNFSHECVELFYESEWSTVWWEFILASEWNYFTRTKGQSHDWNLFSRMNGINLRQQMINSMIEINSRGWMELFFDNKRSTAWLEFILAGGWIILRAWMTKSSSSDKGNLQKATRKTFTIGFYRPQGIK